MNRSTSDIAKIVQDAHAALAGTKNQTFDTNLIDDMGREVGFRTGAKGGFVSDLMGSDMIRFFLGVKND